MAKGKSNSLRYRYPLPVHPIELPQLLPHNPLSWVCWIYSYVKSSSRITPIQVEITGDEFVHILVKEPSQMIYLWDNGFFGTGQLSRSEPTWFERTNAMINGDRQSSPGTPLERITEQRRWERSQFKKRRVEMERQLLELRKNGGTVEEEAVLLENQRLELRNFKASQGSDSSTTISKAFYDFESLFDSEGDLAQLEALELLPVEAVFLSFALPVLDISPNVLFQRLLDYNNLSYGAIYPLVKQYVAYHHYRSHGWCVRSGIKFGCDYLLYRRGPPFQHAQFCIAVLDSEESHDYTWYSSVARVVGGAKKTLILCYVEKLKPEEDIVKMWLRNDFTSAFSSFRVNEVVYRRWVPGKNRD
ncbi:hypothetical protein HG536_0C01600 [Torulaspora globosa]|uniref:tRNA-splicing endonuclease subunit Sen2 n=1 Tax=Torulaspora globosa TaxID=48254 RepID=A0A7G3ZEQ6_9SACH|nr:uncharacterized protein HG536_0C01600 [Torulaspora globosa]QLL31992.1 hypothetical protein HG536_0C01600 [Torulaspora globosa]